MNYMFEAALLAVASNHNVEIYHVFFVYRDVDYQDMPVHFASRTIHFPFSNFIE